MESISSRLSSFSFGLGSGPRAKRVCLQNDVIYIHVSCVLN